MALLISNYWIRITAVLKFRLQTRKYITVSDKEKEIILKNI